ncbi:MAG: TetR/AcrR family transcriptional regulator [Acetobacter sp.]
MVERDNYHHGDLKMALIMASEALIREDGVEGFTLRKAARRAGVSPGAPSHHFDGTKGLLTAVAIRVFEQLYTELSILPSCGVAAVDLRTQAEGYVTFAVRNAGLFRLICRVDLIDCKNPDFIRASYDALKRYGNAAAAYFRQEPPDPSNHVFRPYLASALAIAHGLAHMILEGRAALLFDTADPSQTFVETTLPAVLLAAWPDQSA